MVRTASLEPVALSVLRVVTALLFLEHGTQKLFRYPPGEHAGVNLQSLQGLAGVLEVGGGILLVFGAFTRPVAFVLSGMMAYAYWTVHYPQNAFPVNNGGDAAILFCFVFLYLAIAGGGSIGVDRGK